jgi:alpha-tubulin suppressor-like RCC1 family protein
MREKEPVEEIIQIANFGDSLICLTNKGRMFSTSLNKPKQDWTEIEGPLAK